MKPKLLKISLQPLQSFNVRYDCVPYFFKEFHFHPEIELIHIHKGNGTQFIGNQLQQFKEGDMILLGSELAHCWKCDEKYFDIHSKLKAEATVVHFLPEAFGKDFFDLPEHTKIQSLLLKARLGITIHKKTKLTVSKLLDQLRNSQGSKKIILLLEILDCLSHSKDLRFINKKDFLLIQPEKAPERMNRIVQHMLHHFQNNIQLSEIAEIAHLSPNAFCRYFKLRTKKTYSAFLMEIRINHACQLLTSTNKTVSEICYESGFNNFSNFNRYFKKLTNQTPLSYKNKFE